MARRAVLLAVGVVVVQGLLILWFAWPAANLAPRDLPVVVAGPAPVATAVAGRMQQAVPGGFKITMAPDAAAADQALRDRTAYAAFIITPSGPSLHLASAASPTVAALFTQEAQQLGNGQPVPVVDVVPTPAKDPRGAGFASGFLPLLLTSAAAGAAVTLLRSVAFFDGARATMPLLVLAGWGVVGLALTAVGHYRDRRRSDPAGQLGVPPMDSDERRLGAER